MSSPPPPAARFLTAGWYSLLILNYEVEPHVLDAYVPSGTEIDFWNGRTYLSLVGFLFTDTRVLGVPVPFHRNFEEVNLRFYVRRKADDGWRRGVVFIKEIVPRRLIAFIARTVYNENYVALPMRHVNVAPTALGGSIRYEWHFEGRWHTLAAKLDGAPSLPAAESAAAFITEHYWGYARQRDGSTVEYQVEHPPWRAWPARAARFECDVAALYGGAFVPYLQGEPSSAFVAEGSPIVVRRGTRL